MDYSDPAAWAAVEAAIRRPDPTYGFTANVEVVDDPAFDGLTKDDLLRLAHPAHRSRILFVVDRHTLQDPDHGVLVVKVSDGREFRVVPSAMWGVENNLSLANMDWDEFAECVDDANTFHGF